MSIFRNKLDGSNLYFCSDLHAYHSNITSGDSNWSDKSGCRQFSSKEEMTDCVVQSINEVVPEDGALIHLGDWSFGGHKNIPILRERIKCKTIHHIYGNHDLNIRWKYREVFTSCQDYLEIFASDPSGKYHLVCLLHYSMRIWNDSNKGSFHLYGHSHGTLPPIGRSLDVGWDVWKKPLSFYEVYNILKKVPLHKVDHH